MDCRSPHPVQAPRLLAVLGVFLAAAAFLLGSTARAEKGLNEGLYRDRDGKDHPWSIARGHLLEWNGAPYLPSGVVFHSAHLEEPSPGNLARDEAELDRLRAAGIQDVWVECGPGLLRHPAPVTQALVDALESRGFRYGMRVGDRHQQPLLGFAPESTVLRVPANRLISGARVDFEVPAAGARRVVYALVEGSSNERELGFPIATGEAVVEGESAQIQVQLRNSRRLGRSRGLLYVLPELQVEPEDLGSFGDLWSGMDDYMKRLRAHLKAVRFGPGLRFLLDPFAAGDGTVGREDGVFPSSDGFRAAFQEWLARRFGIHTLNTRWRTNDRAIEGFEEASRLVPTWARNDPPDGDGWLVDPVEKVAYRCTARECSIWRDLEEFRAEALKRWMNAAAQHLEQDGLNVPVLFTWRSYHPLFNNSPSPAGYDGLGAQIYATPADAASAHGAYAFAQVEESARNSWLVAIRLAGPQARDGQPAPIPDGSTARALWSALRGVGFRGVYFDPQQTPNAIELARDLAGTMGSDAQSLGARVPFVFFPVVMSVADRVSRLRNGVWWIPSAEPARLLRYGDSILGYEMARPFGDEHAVQRGTVLWSTSGRQEVTFYVDRITPVSVFDSAGQPVRVRRQRDELRLVLDEEPLVAAGVDAAALFPAELAVEQLREFDRLLKQAEAQKADTAALRTIYQQAEKNLSTANAALIYNSTAPYVAGLRTSLAPFVWIEAERAANHNFSGTAYQAGASGGMYLKLDRAQPPSSGVYRARYVFQVTRDASYDLWVAGRVPGRDGVSGLVWQLNDEPAVPADSVTPTGADYAAGMAWFQLGRVTLATGRHELVLAVPRRAEGGSGRYLAALDAIVLSREPFQPNGAQKPYSLGRRAAPGSGGKNTPEMRPGTLGGTSEEADPRTGRPRRNRRDDRKEPRGSESPPGSSTARGSTPRTRE